MDTIRIIHNLPRSGGTIISKSLGVQKDSVLLSEIHPDGQKVRDAMGVETNLGDPLYQFQNWYDFLEYKDYLEIKNSNLNLLEKYSINSISFDKFREFISKFENSNLVFKPKAS